MPVGFDAVFLAGDLEPTDLFDTDFEATVVLALLPDEDFFVILLADLVGAFFTILLSKRLRPLRR